MQAQGADKKKYAEEATMYNKIASSLMDINYKERINNIYNKVKGNTFDQKFKLSYFKLFYFLFFLIIYISNQHSVEKKIRNINRLEKEVEELRTDYITLKNNFMFSRKETEVLKKAKEIGLQNSDVPPEKIIIE